LLLPKIDCERTRLLRRASADYDCGGYLLVSRGRTLETFKFRRAPGGQGRLWGVKKTNTHTSNTSNTNTSSSSSSSSSDSSSLLNELVELVVVATDGKAGIRTAVSDPMMLQQQMKEMLLLSQENHR
jgi:hypothetical protein